ncbi:alpha/beta fold hydrolase [Roseobacter sp.]|uniref:alpha/beta fold hydrolase n=1 Tax=Roseobacter sp. TaxID=1907202 RepID=UPI00385BA88D
MPVPIALKSCPQADNRPTVVALHGSASHSGQWRQLVTDLQDRYRVLTPDLCGYGAAATHSDHGPITLQEIARALLPVIATSSEPVHLIGHSFGGAVALKIASMWPEKVLSLTLVDPAAFNVVWNAYGISTPHTMAFNQAVRESRNALKTGASGKAMQIFFDFWCGQDAWSQADVRLRSQLATSAHQMHNDYVALVSDRFTKADATAVRCPVTCVTGTASPVEIQHIADVMALKLRRFEHRLVQDATHMAAVTDPDLINPIIGEILDNVDTRWHRCRRAA